MHTFANRLLDLSSKRFILLLVGGDVLIGVTLWAVAGSFIVGALGAVAWNLFLTIAVQMWRP